jgi:transketolase
MSETTIDSVTAENQETAVSPLRAVKEPVVLDYKPKKKKQKKYSKGLEDFQRMEGRVSRISKRVAKAMAKGASTYEQERKKSAGKKKDGSVRDFAPNMGEALSASLREVSSVPADLAEAMNTKGSRRMLRNQIRTAANMLRIPR